MNLCETKMFELRDRATFIPIIATRMCMSKNPRESWLMRRAGYDIFSEEPCVLLARLNGGPACYDPYDYGDRTFHTAHKYITENWEALGSGAVVDVQFILGETQKPAVSEEAGSYSFEEVAP